MADLWSERTSLQSLPPQAALDLILSVRLRRREQRAVMSTKLRAKAAPKQKPVPPLAALSIEQLLKLLETVGGNSLPE